MTDVNQIIENQQDVWLCEQCHQINQTRSTFKILVVEGYPKYTEWVLQCGFCPSQTHIAFDSQNLAKKRDELKKIGDELVELGRQRQLGLPVNKETLAKTVYQFQREKLVYKTLYDNTNAQFRKRFQRHAPRKVSKAVDTITLQTEGEAIE